MTDLSFSQPHPGGRIVARLGEHVAGVIYPGADGEVRWRLILDLSAAEKNARSELAARSALNEALRDWIRRAGLGDRINK